MFRWTWGGMIRVLKPVMAGMALAYLATGFVDGPPPVNFSPENPRTAKQTEIVEPQAELVIERNILKLGSLLTFQADNPALVRQQAAPNEGLGMFYDPGVRGPSARDAGTGQAGTGQ
ncbi:hypothetical protein BerOc1_02416 [Pseudodesulfovibrio hydrargyri]|uniref:Uncharacterized protein n=1 Tax=Pseudodesulfovibrio hydrargyri TaxID=2125990 RepID=A0A1J5MV55_9BACT|nr:hypothetical protein [Pseudodesulfovibrio hydrargyri]OIQ50478.1 hypothetical protein BerOc1_02416 [Pseudodesulfovibrio hydrargyri]